MSLFKLSLTYLLPVYYLYEYSTIIWNIPLYIMDLIVGMFNFIYHMNIVIKTGVYIITVSISMPL